jgi:hypothetical protein
MDKLLSEGGFLPLHRLVVALAEKLTVVFDFFEKISNLGLSV